MKVLNIFIDRPILSIVLSLSIFIGGLVSIFQLPVSEYPKLTPPSIIVTAQYPGANPKSILSSVAIPIEEQLVGTENMLYMYSQATADGKLITTVTFEHGTDPNLAQQIVQNRVSRATPQLPEVTQRIGVSAIKNSQELAVVVHLVSPNKTHDDLYLRNYALINVKNELAKIKGVEAVTLYGSGEYAMRIWLRPDQLAEKGISANEVVEAIRDQNIQVAGGIIGGAPIGQSRDIQLPIDIRGRLNSPEEFGNIIIRSDDNGQMVFLKDIARVSLGSSDYSLKAMLNNQPAVAMFLFQAQDSNAIDISNTVRRTMESMSADFPEDLEHKVIYDPTIFVRSSIEAVVYTLLEALVLVVVIVGLFLQKWRPSSIVLVTVPVSIIGTFLFLYLFDFSINTLSLFGLILSIGIVVDDAIVVVENVERHIIDEGMQPIDAAYKAMQEVTGAILSITATLSAIFIPMAFVGGLTGRFYDQFALTIAISSIISAVCSLTLTPALCALFLKDSIEPPDRFDLALHRIFGRLFTQFNGLFNKASDRYSLHVGYMLRKKSKLLLLYTVLILLTIGIVNLVPKGFLPNQDKQYLISVIQLNEGANLDHTTKVVEEIARIGLEQPGVVDAVQFPGLSINGFTNSSSQGVVFFILDDFDQRTSHNSSAFTIARKLQKKFIHTEEAFVAVVPPPVILGLGTTGGFKLQIEDRGGAGHEELSKVVKQVLREANQKEELFSVYSNYNVNVPQLGVEIDRLKLKQLGLSYKAVVDAMQIYLGSLYVNDFNKFGHVFQVIVQADAEYRDHPADLMSIKVPNSRGEMIPLGSILTIHETFGPESSTHYNAYLSADINGFAGMGYTLGQAEETISLLLDEMLPPGFVYEWTDLTYQDKLSGNTILYILPISILFVFLILAVYFNSWVQPTIVVLVVPLSILSTLIGVIMSDSDNNIFTQVSLFVLTALSCKNVILIIDFSRDLERKGMGIFESAIAACRIRLRPVLMTSSAFIIGVLPMVFSTGAGAEMRNVMGASVFAGMIGTTFFSLIFTPVLYVVFRNIENKFIKSTAFSKPLTRLDRKK
ncbi:MAG: multidrug efflux RND transporter permease subunit [Cellvibrionales bacterium]|nr:multidrug efflux RND transporter permease subunit [Cellvibrionales bacterium]